MASLFALGQDAWNILTWLDLMRKDPQFVFPGQSGNYRIGASGRIEREPAWAQFELGRPVPLGRPATARPGGFSGPSPSRPATPGPSEPAAP